MFCTLKHIFLFVLVFFQNFPKNNENINNIWNECDIKYLLQMEWEWHCFLKKKKQFKETFFKYYSLLPSIFRLFKCVHLFCSRTFLCVIIWHLCFANIFWNLWEEHLKNGNCFRINKKRQIRAAFFWEIVFWKIAKIFFF